MTLIVQPDGSVKAIYGEELELTSLGPLRVKRASHVEHSAVWQQWYVWLDSIAIKLNLPNCQRFNSRKEALAWEVSQLEENLHLL